MLLRTVLCTIFAVLLAHRAQCAGPPKVTQSYIAYGEITQPLKEMKGYELQSAFEETYDAGKENSAFVIWMMGMNVTFVKNFKTNQTFRYTEGKDCVETNEREWIQSEYPPALLAFEDDNGTITFSLRQLFNLPDKYLQRDKQGISAVYRGVPAKLWIYEIPGKDEKGYKKKLNIYAYWSDGTWTTSSNEKSVPLGYMVAKTMWSQKVNVDETVISVFGFVTETYDRKLFEPRQGIICANRTQTLKFPTVQNIKAIAMHSEMVLPDYQEIRYIDTWFDPQNQLVRIDVERLRDEDPFSERKTKRYQSEIAIGKLGVVFSQSVFKEGFRCDVIPFAEYLNDLQNFIDVKQDLKKWKMGKLFGLNDTNYVYTGKTVKGDKPCHVFQGIRTDWPEESANVTSLWEWCFNVNMSKENDIVMFLNDEMGVLSAQVTILTSDDPQEYPPGFRMFHHFYEVSVQDPAILDATKFDISRCFTDGQKIALQFYLDWEVTDDNIHIAENLTSDVNFLQNWKSAIYQNSGLQSYSLRIAKVQSTITDKRLYVKFVILNDHEKLPQAVWIDQISAADAEENLRKNVKDGKVSINYVMQKGKPSTTLKVAKDSVTPQINPDVEHHTLSPLTSPETTTPPTKFPFSLKTDPETKDETTSVKDDLRTTKSTRDPGKITQTTGVPVKTTQPTGDPGKTTQPTGDPVKTTQSTGDPGHTTQPTGSTVYPTVFPTKKLVLKMAGHQPGTVAAVSIAMLLCGVTIGSAGTFYKFFGFPSCMK